MPGQGFTDVTIAAKHFGSLADQLGRGVEVMEWAGKFTIAWHLSTQANGTHSLPFGTLALTVPLSEIPTYSKVPGVLPDGPFCES